LGRPVLVRAGVAEEYRRADGLGRRVLIHPFILARLPARIPVIQRAGARQSALLPPCSRNMPT
jgi:hypothetical protein